MQKTFIILLLLFVCFGYSINITNAEKVKPQATTDPPKTVSLTDPLGGSHPKPAELIGRIIHAALGIVGSIALAMFIYGGFVWMTAAGNSEKVQKGKDVLIWAAIGLVIIFSAYALVNFVIQKAILGT